MDIKSHDHRVGMESNFINATELGKWKEREKRRLCLEIYDEKCKGLQDYIFIKKKTQTWGLHCNPPISLSPLMTPTFSRFFFVRQSKQDLISHVRKCVLLPCRDKKTIYCAVAMTTRQSKELWWRWRQAIPGDQRTLINCRIAFAGSTMQLMQPYSGQI